MKSISVLFFMLCFSQNGIAGAKDFHSMQVDEHVREYILYLPDNLPKDAPLVFVFHGYSGDAESMSTFALNEIADKKGFAVCYPQGWIDQKGNRFWQVGYKFHKNIKVDDAKFICTLAETLQKKYKLSKENTFIVGFSNGGDLCNLLLCQTSGIFKAAAPIISCIMKETYDSCKNSEPVPVFMLNGTADNITYWNGDADDSQGYGPYISTEAMLDFRLSQNKCTLVSTDTIVSSDPNETTSVVVQKYSNDDTKNQVWMYRVVNGGHGHPSYIDLEEEIWNFFSNYID